MAGRRLVNLVSDTVTQPCARMRTAMANAIVGDDVHGTDPTVKKLQVVAAEMLGKERALFVPSGTMSNLIAVGAHCQRGDEIVLGKKSHIFTYEGAGVSAYLGVGMNTVPTQPNGSLSVADVESAIRDDDPHYPRTTLVAVENTHNTCGGRVVPTEAIRDIASICASHNLKLHMDGARLANASVYLQAPLSELVASVDSVSLCLSKGLGAPVGSILAGSEELIYKAMRLRKSLGGGMRQSGILAAAALFALENNIQRLAEDHANARTLARGLSRIPGIVVDEATVETNMVYFTLDAQAVPNQVFLARMKELGVLMGGGYGKQQNQIRAVTHLDVTSDDIETVLRTANTVMSTPA
ncbi:L-allo-threonine aldolase [Achlya hypogyna]|uniref:L-allo-threonine aldolase n=1 Tax=Achlya hypogyna TaxID=1202772 RepID=A0A1V9ZG07_ACHHY|nr:L-allo-threonine aldolase [Achlya hypogyna]